MSYRSLAHRFASSPPSAPRISTITLRPALGSAGSSSSFSSASSASICASALFDFGTHDLAVVAGRVRQHVLGRFEIAVRLLGRAVRADDRLEFLVATREVAHQLLIGVNVGRGQARFDVVVLLLQRGESLAHVLSLPERPSWPEPLRPAPASRSASARRCVDGNVVAFGHDEDEFGVGRVHGRARRRPRARGQGRRRPNTRRRSPSPTAGAIDVARRSARGNGGSTGVSCVATDKSGCATITTLRSHRSRRRRRHQPARRVGGAVRAAPGRPATAARPPDRRRGSPCGGLRGRACRLQPRVRRPRPARSPSPRTSSREHAVLPDRRRRPPPGSRPRTRSCLALFSSGDGALHRNARAMSSTDAAVDPCGLTRTRRRGGRSPSASAASSVIDDKAVEVTSPRSATRRARARARRRQPVAQHPQRSVPGRGGAAGKTQRRQPVRPSRCGQDLQFCEVQGSST